MTATPAPEPPAPRASRLRVNLGTYPDILDPQKSSFVNEIAHLKLIYEGLTRLNKDLETVPGAAEKWEYNADATELTFTLRKDLKYSDGTLLNAKRYEYSILRNINPATAGEYAQITDEITGAPNGAAPTLRPPTTTPRPSRPCQGPGPGCRRRPLHRLRTGRLPDPQGRLRQPAPYFHTVMCLWVTYPAKEENITEGGENWWNMLQVPDWQRPLHPETLEPFVRGYFVPNPNYWGGRPL